MARKKSITKESLLAPRRCSPRFLPNNSPQHSNPKSPVAQLPKNSNLKFDGSTIPPKLRRSARLIGETKEKQEDPKNGNYGKISEGFSSISFGDNLRRRVLLEVKKDELCNGVLGNIVKRVTRSGGSINGKVGVNRGDNRCEDVGGRGCEDVKLGRIEEFGYIGKRVTRRGGLRNGSGFGEKNGSFECDRGDNRLEDEGKGGCKDETLGRVEESGYIGKRVTRSVFRNGSDCERNCDVDCKGRGSCSLSEVGEGGVFKDERSKRVGRESRMVTRRVTRGASLKNGSEYEGRNGNVDCNAEDNCPLSEHLGGGSCKDEKLKRVVKEPTRISKRVTRGASYRNESEYEQKNGNADCNAGDNRPLSEYLNGVFKKKSKRVVKESRLISRRVTRSASHRNGSEREVIDDNVDCDVDDNAKDEHVGKKQLGQKRKKNQQKGECGCITGWTKEQEIALQKAYFAVKPTPHFWKKVAKMVPGKSAQDCFDRIHSDHKTPQTKKQSRAKIATPSALSFSASKLLSTGTRRSKFSKRNRHLAQKTVRQLLQTQVHVNKDGADLFAVLEKSGDPFSTPKQTKRFNLLNICQETSSSANRKQLSRFSNSSMASLTSPPVLKQIKNIALHEKYIDQLHCREAKRRASVGRFSKQIKNNIEKNRFDGGNDEVVKAAKNALFLGATDSINQFQQSQMGTVDSFDLSDAEIPCSDDDENEGCL